MKLLNSLIGTGQQATSADSFAAEIVVANLASAANIANNSNQYPQMYASAASLQNIPKQVRYPFGELYTRNQPLPVDWRGAEYGEVEREVENGCWKLTFSSKWTHETIIVHLDLQTLSGEQVDRMAKTFLEVINQRRLG